MIEIHDSTKIRIFDELCAQLTRLPIFKPGEVESYRQQLAAELLAYSVGWDFLFQVLWKEAQGQIDRHGKDGLLAYFRGLMDVFIKARHGDKAAVQQLRAIHRMIHPNFYGLSASDVEQVATRGKKDKTQSQPRITDSITRGQEILKIVFWARNYVKPAKAKGKVELKEDAYTASTSEAATVRDCLTKPMSLQQLAIRIYQQRPNAGIDDERQLNRDVANARRYETWFDAAGEDTQPWNDWFYRSKQMELG